MIKLILTLGLGALLLASWPMQNGPRFAKPVAPEPVAELIPVSGCQSLGGGPVHEAIADPWIGPMRPPPIAPRAPPAAMEESPPEQPQGNNVRWIGGYWECDDTCHFRWVSGIWHDLPPGRQWVPGHWARAGDGWQRIPGYWAQYADSRRPFRSIRARSRRPRPTTSNR